MPVLTATALAGLPEVRAGDDLGQLIVRAARAGRAGRTGGPERTSGSERTSAAGRAGGAGREGPGIESSDIVVVAHKIVSKAEGRTVALDAIEPGEQARELASAFGKDARHVQAILDQTAVLVRAERGVLICRTSHGFVCANAGVDASNTLPGTLVLLPRDPDASARALRARIRELTGAAPAVLITDSFGRAWRNGQQEVALGCAGLEPLEDWRGRADAAGRTLTATWVALADQVAAAADLARAKDSREPVVVVGGLGRHVSADDGPGAAALVRPPSEDMFG
jgi:coenzyme F420-0:L-glutamate ligase/coenzyme F420-1:gamma-L-glutamate ligase